MEMLGRLLQQLEGMSDADIAEEVRRRFCLCISDCGKDSAFHIEREQLQFGVSIID